MPTVVEFQGEQVKLPKGITEDELWIPRVRGGYDPLMGKYRDKEGTWRTEEYVQSMIAAPENKYGGVVNHQIISTPWSNAWERYDRVVGGITTEDLDNLSSGLREAADPKPRAIENEMKRAEHFFWQERDIAQSFIIPMELTLQDVYAESESKEMEELLNLAYGEEIGLGLRGHLTEMYLCMCIFGVVFPAEIWDKKSGPNPIPTNIIPLHPLDVEVGQRQSRDNFSLLLPTPPGGEWTKKYQEQLKPIQTVLEPPWSDRIRAGQALIINPELCRPIRWHALSFDAYAHPPLAGMFRPITTRVLVEEARRAIIEGYRQQMWIMQVGDTEHRGTAGEIAHLRDQLNTMRGQRTNTLLWSGNLSAQVITPEDMEALMNNTLWLSLTMDIMRRRGISLRVISGESPTSGGSGGDAEVDIRMLMMRLDFMRWKLLRWVAGLTRRIMEIDAKNFWQRKAAIKELKNTRVLIRPTPEQMKALIQDVMEPLVGIGVVSHTTLLKAVNLSYETELRYKKEELPNKELFAPPPTFTQRAEKPDGSESETSSPRRGQTQTDKRKVTRQLEASVLGQEEDEKDARAKKLYQEWLAIAWGLAAYEAEQADVAATQLRATIARYMLRAGGLGYQAVGGTEGIDREWMRRGIRSMQGYVVGLEQDWDSMTPDRLRWRLGLYAQEGMRIGYVMGAQQAAKETHQAAFWKRVLRESESGPCVQCQEDSFHLHSIDEPFFEYHPQGVCGAQALAFFRMDGETPAFVEINIPIVGDVWES